MANVYPNSDTYTFCQWILNSIYARLTPSRTAIVQTISTAALAGTYVSQRDWNTFIDVTNRLYSPWQQQVALTDIPVWTDYSAMSIIVGFSSYTTKNIYYKIVGDTMFVNFWIEGQSNATSFTFTVPQPLKTGVFGVVNMADVGNNGTAATGICYLPSASSVIQVWRDVAHTNFTASGDKFAFANICVPINLP